MPSRFAPDGNHPTLSPAARALTAPALEAAAIQAESVLSGALAEGGRPRLSAVPLPAAGGGEDPRLIIAMARQINYQLVVDAAGAGAYAAEKRGEQQVEMAGKDGRVSPVDPAALLMLQEAVSELVQPPAPAPAAAVSHGAGDALGAPIQFVF